MWLGSINLDEHLQGWGYGKGYAGKNWSSTRDQV